MKNKDLWDFFSPNEYEYEEQLLLAVQSFFSQSRVRVTQKYPSSTSSS